MQQVDSAIAAGTWPHQPAPTLYSWGGGAQGQLGLGNRTSYSSPKQVGSLTDWLYITGEASSTLATKTDGTLWAWGDNSIGQLGLNNTTSYSSPKQVGALTNWLNIAAGYYHALAIKTDGSLWSWGYNVVGQLGLGNRVAYSSPKQVGLLTTWASLGVNQYSSFAIKTDGTLWAWGQNTYGNLGNGSTTRYSSPIQVGALTNWLKVAGSSAGYTTLAIKTNGTLWAWGLNNNGQLGINSTSNVASPVQIGALTTWSSITGNQYSAFAIKTDNTLWAWGLNYFGNLGLNNSTYAYSSPKQVGSLTNWSSIVGGKNHVLALQSNGTLWGWGSNDIGQLGLNSQTARYSSPKQVGSLTSWTTIGVAPQFSYGIASV